MRKNKKILLLLPLLILTSCTEEVGLTMPVDGVITYSEDNIYEINLSYEEMSSDLKVNDDLTDLQNYFINYGVKYKTQYIFSDTLTVNQKIFIFDFNYDTAKTKDAFMLTARYLLDDKDSLPDSYYESNVSFDYHTLTSKQTNGYYCYDYVKDNEDNYTEEKISYYDISYYASPKIKSAKFIVDSENSTIPNDKKKDDDLVASGALETIRASYFYADAILKKVSTTLTLW